MNFVSRIVPIQSLWVSKGPLSTPCSAQTALGLSLVDLNHRTRCVPERISEKEENSVSDYPSLNDLPFEIRKEKS